ncbi:hypothetical protein Tco_0910985 [Tanacetum coccineum]|uniref:Uncharacterized protein n=1 Tax=Tanacetum coccineum TaxID=301880 RepID=A0ABQ5CUG9_9ASTR
MSHVNHALPTNKRKRRGKTKNSAEGDRRSEEVGKKGGKRKGERKGKGGSGGWKREEKRKDKKPRKEKIAREIATSLLGLVQDQHRILPPGSSDLAIQIHTHPYTLFVLTPCIQT